MLRTLIRKNSPLLICALALGFSVLPATAHAQAAKRRAANATAAAAPASAEAAYQKAREGFRKQDSDAIDAAAPYFKDHPLAYYADYWRLMLTKTEKRNEGMEVDYHAFIDKNSGSYLADRTRMELLKALGKKAALTGDWAAFDEQFPKLGWDDPDTTCYSILSRHAKKEEAAAREGLWVWLTPKELPEGCVFLTEALLRDKKLYVPQVWDRIKVLVDANLPGAALRATRYLPEAQIPAEKDWTLATTAPARWMAKVAAGELDGKSRSQRELTLVAIAKMARDTPRQAAEFWTTHGKAPFTEAERQWGWGLIGHQAARKHIAEAAKIIFKAFKTLKIHCEEHSIEITHSLMRSLRMIYPSLRLTELPLNTY